VEDFFFVFADCLFDTFKLSFAFGRAFSFVGFKILVSLGPFNFGFLSLILGFLSLQLKDVKFARLVLVLRPVVGILILRLIFGLPGLFVR
jgi:hypothetical protein